MSERTVLIADDDPDIVATLAEHIGQLGLRVEAVTNGLDALVISLRQPPDLLILDINMPAVDGLTVCEKLIADHQIPPFPVLILTGRTDSETIRRCVETGAHYCPKQQEMWRRLKPLVCKYLHLGSDVAADDEPPLPDAPSRVLIVDDDPDLSGAINARLSAHGVEVMQAENGKQGYWMALRDKPDLIITDLMMPELSGEAMIRKLIYAPSTQNIPILVLTGQRVNGDTDFAMKRELMSRRNTVEYLTKPVDLDAVIAKLRKHIEFPQNAVETQPADQLATPQ